MAPRLISYSFDSRKDISEAAVFCFAEYGYEVTSLRIIAMLARKNMSLNTCHFGNKEGLLREVILYLGLQFAGLLQPEEGNEADRPRMATGISGRTRLVQSMARVLSTVETGGRSGRPIRDVEVRRWLSELRNTRTVARDIILNYSAPLVMDRGSLWMRGRTVLAIPAPHRCGAMG